MKTLEQLIKECDGENGQRFRWLKNCKEYWIAQARPTHNKEHTAKDIKVKGKTAREAVENLLIALNTHDTI